MSESVTTLLQYFLAVSGTILGVLAYINVILMKQQKKTVVRAIKDNAAAELADFRLLLDAEVVMAIGFLVFAVGGYYDSPILLQATRATGILFILVLARVFYRRERRVAHGSW